MNFFLTDQQSALNTLLVSTRETRDHYRDAAELVTPELKTIFNDISQRRKGFILRLENAVRESGTLPAVPDPDKEAGEMLLHHVGALIKDHYENNALEQRIAGEQKLAGLVVEAKEKTTVEMPLLDELAQHIVDTLNKLEPLHQATEQDK